MFNNINKYSIFLHSGILHISKHSNIKHIPFPLNKKI